MGRGPDLPPCPWMGRDVLGWVEMSVKQLGSVAARLVQGWSLHDAARRRLPAAAKPPQHARACGPSHVALTEVFGSRSRVMRAGPAAEHTHPPRKEKMS